MRHRWRRRWAASGFSQLSERPSALHGHFPSHNPPRRATKQGKEEQEDTAPRPRGGVLFDVREPASKEAAGRKARWDQLPGEPCSKRRRQQRPDGPAEGSLRRVKGLPPRQLRDQSLVTLNSLAASASSREFSSLVRGFSTKTLMCYEVRCKGHVTLCPKIRRPEEICTGHRALAVFSVGPRPCLRLTPE